MPVTPRRYDQSPSCRPRPAAKLSSVVGDILQPTHLIFVLVVALLVLGPKRLPEVGRSLGKGLRDFKTALSTDEPAFPEEVPVQTHSTPTSTPTAETSAPATESSTQPAESTTQPAESSPEPAESSPQPAEHLG
jgi:sec-independent protein translocase protein TatA